MKMWLHWRGGDAHSAATVAPRILRDQGEAFDGIVVSPRGRGSSTWYLGKGHVDVNEVWADALAAFTIDQDRVYVSGHSMGGWGSYLLSILYPDRFAAAFPSPAGDPGRLDRRRLRRLRRPPVRRLHALLHRDQRQRPAAQHTRRLLENLRNVPLAIFQGGADELVPVSGVTRQVERLVELGYRHRYYVFPTYEHYSHPVDRRVARRRALRAQLRARPQPGSRHLRPRHAVRALRGDRTVADQPGAAGCRSTSTTPTG